jgi:hypothetical protein
MMNKDELKELFQEPLEELTNFENEIQKIKKLINFIIENFDLLKDDVTDEQIGEISSEINVKSSKIISLIKDIMSDSKRLESFIHEIKILKRKRDKKLGKDKKIDNSELEKLLEIFKQKKSPYTTPSQPYIQPYQPQPFKPRYPPSDDPWTIKF